MTAPSALRAGPVAMMLGLFLFTLAMRPQLVAVSPLLPRIQDELEVSHAVAGLLTTIPIVCMGLFAPLGPWVASHVGPRRALAICLVGIIAFGLARAVAPGLAPVIAATVGLGLAMGTAGALMSIVVKTRAANRPAMATGAYSAGYVTGAMLAAAAAVPLAVAFGGWRESLAALAILAVPSLLGWLWLMTPDPRTQEKRVSPPSLPWRSPMAWGLALVWGLQSLLYYGVLSWLPSVYVERGDTEASAAFLIVLLQVSALITGLGIPLIADRVGSRRMQLAIGGVAVAVSVVGFIVLPDAGVFWALAIGVALGSIFPLSLTLPVDVAKAPDEAGAAAAFMLLAGYLIAAIGPVLLGLARDATGNFAASLWLLVGLAIVFSVVSSLLSPARLERGVRPVVPGP